MKKLLEALSPSLFLSAPMQLETRLRTNYACDRCSEANRQTERGNITKIIMAGIAIVILTGYVGSASSELLTTMDEKELRNQPTIKVCAAYARTRDRKMPILSGNMKKELQRRNYFIGEEWQVIKSRQFYIGMSTEALICSLGFPGSHGSANESAGSWGRGTQWVYRSCPTCKATYIYTRNGKVTSWQK